MDVFTVISFKKDRSIFKCKKKGFPLFSVFLFGTFRLATLLGDRARVVSIEREAHRTTMNIILVCTFALTVIHTGCTIANVRCTLLLRELEAAVSALVESTFRWNIHLFA